MNYSAPKCVSYFPISTIIFFGYVNMNPTDTLIRPKPIEIRLNQRFAK